MIAPDVQEQILDKLNTLIVVLNNDGSIDYVSKSANQLLGYEPSHLLGQNWWEKTRFTRPEGIQIKNKILNLFKNRSASVNTFEHLLRTSEGGQKWFSWDISYLNEEQLIGFGHDITDKKQNEKRLIENNKTLLQQNKDITDSIYYAKRIQQSILQSAETLKSIFGDSFLLYRPKDIVSGDYYWFYEDENFKYTAVADCTGHGVPGAMMSMVADSLFKEIFINKKMKEPKEILYALDHELSISLNKNNTEPCNDGMDVSLVRINKKTMELTFAGAFRSLIISGKDDLTELKGNRYPIGFYSDIDKTFESINFQLQNNDCVYLFSDGYIDQFGGENDKKLNKSNFKELVRTVYEMPMEEQEAFLEYSFNNWKQDHDKTDDVCVIGIKV
jgi:PAS domain S-box-containing protein